MQFNPDKCEVIRITNRKSKKLTVPYSIHNSVLREVKAAKYLRVTIDDRLTWNEHVDAVAKKASSTRAFLQRNINRCPRNIKEVCYKTFVRPTVEYAATVWDTTSARNIQTIEQVQRRAARFVTSRYTRDDSPTAMVAELGWLSLAHRWASARVLMMY